MKLKIEGVNFNRGEIEVEVKIEPTDSESFIAFNRNYVFGEDYTKTQIRAFLQERLDEFNTRLTIVEGAQDFIGTELLPS